MAKKKEKVESAPKDSAQAWEEKAARFVARCKQESLDYYNEKFKQFNYFDRLYLKGAAKTNTPYGRANLELPLAFQQVEPYVSNMTETMVGEAPYIRYGSRTLDSAPAADNITDYTQYQLERGGFLFSYTQLLRNTGKYGSGFYKIVWETDQIEVDEESPQIRWALDPETKQPTPVQDVIIQKRDYVTHDGPRFYNKSIFDIFIPKSAVSCDVQKMEWIIDRSYRTIEELIDNPNYTKGRKKLKDLLKKSELEKEDASGYNGVSSGFDQPKLTELQQKNPKGSTKFSGKSEVLEWWGNYKLTEKGEKEPALITVAVIDGESVLLRFDKNPLKYKFKPFIMTNDYPVNGEAYGIGELHHIKGLIEESTALRNARLDVANISLNRVWLVERQSGVNLRELYTAPNKIILTNDLNGIRALDMGGVTPSSVQELARIDWDIQNTTDIVNARQDVATVGQGFGDTATGVNFLSQKANARMITKARLLEELFFRPLANILNWYNKDILAEDPLIDGKDPSTYYFQRSNEENPYGQIDAQIFLTEVDFRPSSNPTKLNRAQMKQDMSYMLQVVGQVEKVKPGTHNLAALLTDAYKLYGFPHPDKYLNPPSTTVIQLPNGQLVDQYQKPVQVVQIGPDGKPVQPPEGMNGNTGTDQPPSGGNQQMPAGA